jgi:hypothetical protein
MSCYNCCFSVLVIYVVLYSDSPGWSHVGATDKDEKKDPQDPPPILTAKPLQFLRDDDEAHKKLKALYNQRVALTKELYMEYRSYKELKCDLLLNSARRLVRTGLEVYEKPEKQVDFLKQMMELPTRLAAVMDKRIRIAPLDREKLGEFAAELEYEMAKAKKAATKEKKK